MITTFNFILHLTLLFGVIFSDKEHAYLKKRNNRNNGVKAFDSKEFEDKAGMKKINEIQTLNRLLVTFPSFIPDWANLLEPTNKPSRKPTNKPSHKPTHKPSREPTLEPTNKPTRPPTLEPTPYPTRTPSFTPSDYPSITPTEKPSLLPSIRPSLLPSAIPTLSPSISPSISQIPTEKPSLAPSFHPSSIPSSSPTYTPSSFPSVSLEPSSTPSISLHVFPINKFYLSLSTFSHPINADDVLKTVDSHLVSFFEDNTHPVLNFNSFSLSILNVYTSSSNKHSLRFGFEGEVYFRTLDKIDDDFINGLVVQAFNGLNAPIFLFSLQNSGLDVENIYYLFDVKEDDEVMETRKTSKTNMVKILIFVGLSIAIALLSFYYWNRHLSPSLTSFMKRRGFGKSSSVISKHDNFQKDKKPNEKKQNHAFMSNWYDTNSEKIDSSQDKKAEETQSSTEKKQQTKKKPRITMLSRNQKHKSKERSQFQVKQKFLDKMEKVKNEKNFWRKHENTEKPKNSDSSHIGDEIQILDQPKDMSMFRIRELYLDNEEGLDVSVVSSAQYEYTINGSIAENNNSFSTASYSSDGEDDSLAFPSSKLLLEPSNNFDSLVYSSSDNVDYTINDSTISSENKSNRNIPTMMSTCSSFNDDYTISELYQDSPLTSKKEKDEKL